MRAFEMVPAHGIRNFCEVIGTTRFGGLIVRWEGNNVEMTISKQGRERIMKDTPENQILATQYSLIAKLQIHYTIEAEKMINKMEGV